MTHIDLIVLLFYVLGVFLVGFVFSGRNSSVNEMFSAGGESPWWLTGLSSFMTLFSAGTFVVWGGIAYKYGLVAITINIGYGVAALAAGYMIAGRWKEQGVSTPAEFIERRFGSGILQLYTCSLLLFRLSSVAVALYSLAVIASAILPVADGSIFAGADSNTVSVPLLILFFGSIVVVYTCVGGLWAVLMTDALQFVILNLSVIFILALTLLEIGDINSALQLAPDGFFEPTGGGYGYFFIVGWSVIQFFIVGAEWAFAQRHLSVSSPKDARKATYLFGVLYLLSPVLWLAPPLIYGITNPGLNSEQAYILAGQAVLPNGLTGLLVAAMFSATASMVSSQLNVFAGVLTHDYYYKRIKPNATPLHLVKVGRFFTVLLGLCLMGFAVAIPYIGGAERVIIGVASLLVGPLLAPTIWALLSNKTDSSMVWITVIMTVGFGVLLKFGFLEGSPLNQAQLGSSLSNWLANNTQSVDLVIGLLVPCLTLFLCHALSKRVSKSLPVSPDFDEEVKNTPALVTFDPLPGRVIYSALFGSALTVFLLIFVNGDTKFALFIFGLCLSLIALLCAYLTEAKTR